MLEKEGDGKLCARERARAQQQANELSPKG